MTNDGVTIGLQLWLLFLAIFFVIGYPPGFSIILGAIAALAGGYLAQWTKAKIQAPPPPPAKDEESPLKRAQNRLRSLQIGQVGKVDRQGTSGKGWFGRKRRRSLTSRR